jgi:hypothetical protein
MPMICFLDEAMGVRSAMVLMGQGLYLNDRWATMMFHLIKQNCDSVGKVARNTICFFMLLCKVPNYSLVL